MTPPVLARQIGGGGREQARGRIPETWSRKREVIHHMEQYP